MSVQPTSLISNADDRRVVHRHLWFLAITAVALRTLYVILAISHLGFDQLAAYALDSEAYLSVARQILGGDPMGSYYLFRVGPGYGLILAGLQKLFGASLAYPTAFNILMGGLAPVFIYLLAFHLTGLRIVGLLSGLLTAISPTSISLSCLILTDQPFFTFHTAGMVCFVLGFTTGRKRWFIISGLLASAALLIRSTALLWPLLLLIVALIIPVTWRFSSRRSMIGHVALTASLMIIIIVAWSYRNYVVNDVFTLGSNGVLTMRSCLGARAVVENTDEDDIMALRERWIDEDGEYRGIPSRVYYDRAKNRFMNIVTEHPGWVIKAYLRTVWSNMRTGNYLPLNQIPALDPIWRLLIRLQEKWLGVIVFLGSLIGIVYLYLDKNYLAAVFLGLTLIYFTFLAGFSFWQGSRIYFPSSMASSILLVYAAYRIWPQIRRMMGRRLE